MEPNESLPFTKDTPVLRTYFEDDAGWKAICDLLRQPCHEAGQDYYAYLDFVDDPTYRDRTEPQLLSMVPRDYWHTFLFVVDKTSCHRAEFHILVLDLRAEPGRSFRAIPSQVPGIKNNLSISNMDFYEFADNVDPDGVFRGFKNP
jgi:hypothetical protein